MSTDRKMLVQFHDYPFLVRQYLVNGTMVPNRCATLQEAIDWARICMEDRKFTRAAVIKSARVLELGDLYQPQPCV